MCVCVLVEEGDGFDWVAYLKEGIEFPSYSDSDSEVYVCTLFMVY